MSGAAVASGKTVASLFGLPQRSVVEMLIVPPRFSPWHVAASTSR
jgi:hypothetical protein